MTQHDEDRWSGLDPEVVDALLNDLTIDFTTHGRASKRPHRIEIWMVAIDGELFITGTPGARDWYANVVATPECVIHLKQGVHADVAAHAVVVSDPDRRRHVLTHSATAWYRGQGDELAFLLSDAPLVQLVIVA